MPSEKEVLGKAFGPYQYYKQRERELTEEASKNGNNLPLHMMWRLQYYRNPYLILETDEKILERFGDLFSNILGISKECKIEMTPGMQGDARLVRYFTEIIEETNWRGILTPEATKGAASPIGEYFKGGTPLGCQMFGDREHVPNEWVVKYSKAEYVQDMYRFGRFRISPASDYSKGSYIKAIKDYETSRPYKLKALSDLLQRGNVIEAQGMKMTIQNGLIPLNVEVDDYYLFSTCKELDRRMPTDFEADAALIVKDRGKFSHRLRKAMLAQQPSWTFLEGEVYYYDPYNDIPKGDNQEFWKHYAYSYQKEYRYILRSWRMNYETLQPFFIEIGPLDDIAEVVIA
ncbi:hypothetical protein [Ruegeria arenilitoris]|uniref:hypothetical protein n=1 Tax=Ruegeria arenilitoris TaxID=1173585 RepID=UPI00147D8CE8|nr:hypothetical protein [Ruegeria arenilitoris]